jgi:hypothetical protein
MPLDSRGALDNGHNRGKLQGDAVARVLTMQPPWLATFGSIPARCSRSARAVPISSRP